MTHHDLNLSRRAALQGIAGLVVGVCLPELASAQQSGAARAFRPGDTAAAFVPNAFVRVGADDTVTVLIKHIEFGQGPFTGLATLVAEEMDADWSKVAIEWVPADAKVYGYKDPSAPSNSCGSSAAARYSFITPNCASPVRRCARY